MTDKNQREWPSFNDILEELNTLGGLSAAPSTPEPTSLPLLSTPGPLDQASVEETSDWAFDTEALFEADTAEADQIDSDGLGADQVEADTTDSELVDTDEFGVSFEAPTPAAPDAPDAPEPDDAPAFDPIIPESTAPDSIDWSSWDFQPEAISADPFSAPPIEADPIADAAPGDEAGVVFQIDTTDIDPEPAEAVDAELELDDTEAMSAEQPSPIDSVATADEIEDDLQELFNMVEVDETEASQIELEEQTEAPADATELASLDELTSDEFQLEAPEIDPSAEDLELAAAVEALSKDSEQPAHPDNVVPLHPDPVDYTHEVVGLDGAFDPARPQPVEPQAAAEFVGVETDDTDSDDKWDYLRPGDEEVAAGSIWSRRRKFFGGDERKTQKAARRQTEEDETFDAGPPCPKCDAPGHVDLDDPIGGKIHLSCHKCDHVWSQLADTQPESA